MNASELISILDYAEVDPRSVRILDSGVDDALCLTHESQRWQVYYSDRGQRFDVEEFDTEDAACVAFLQRFFRSRSAARLAGPTYLGDAPPQDPGGGRS